VENLLTLALPEGAPAAELDLGAVLDQALALFDQQLAQKGIALERHFQPDLPRVVGNASLLLQVFVNLIQNAGSAMPDGGTLTVECRSDSADRVQISFRDTGRGIPEEDVPSIFDPFFTTKPVGEGMGLGLTLSDRILAQHGGTIELSSRVDEGTTVTIRLPTAAATGSKAQTEPWPLPKDLG